MKAFQVNQYKYRPKRLLELHVPIPRELAPQQKALTVMRGLGPITLSRTATGPSSGTYVAKLWARFRRQGALAKVAHGDSQQGCRCAKLVTNKPNILWHSCDIGISQVASIEI